jgi:uncharacterized protein
MVYKRYKPVMKAQPRYQKSEINSREKDQLIRNFSDNFTHIVPVPSKHYFPANKSVMIAGFPSPGMIGSIVCAHLIEQLGMHQIAYVHSKHIMPGVLWVGGKLRHPFRIYSSQDNSVCVLTCDVPVIQTAVDSISSTITNWCHKNKMSKLLIVSGSYPENIQPFPHNFANRMAFVIENNNNFKSTAPNNDKVNGNEIPEFAFIGGLAGQILGDCVVRFIHCLAVLVPTLSFSPDPEGAALAIEAIGSLIPKAKVNSSQLRQEAEKIKTQLSELGKLQYRLVKNNRPEDLIRDDKEQIYK